MNAEDENLIQLAENVMAEDVHDVRNIIIAFSSYIKICEEQYKFCDKIDLYRKILRSYVSRRTNGEKINIKSVEKEF